MIIPSGVSFESLRSNKFAVLVSLQDELGTLKLAKV
ncbi:hypothetical protein IGJ41_002736 [Enterococcus sp. DIV1537a]